MKKLVLKSILNGVAGVAMLTGAAAAEDYGHTQPLKHPRLEMGAKVANGVLLEFEFDPDNKDTNTNTTFFCPGTPQSVKECFQQSERGSSKRSYIDMKTGRAVVEDMGRSMATDADKGTYRLQGSPADNDLKLLCPAMPDEKAEALTNEELQQWEQRIATGNPALRILPNTYGDPNVYALPGGRYLAILKNMLTNGTPDTFFKILDGTPGQMQELQSRYFSRQGRIVTNHGNFQYPSMNDIVRGAQPTFNGETARLLQGDEKDNAIVKLGLKPDPYAQPFVVTPCAKMMM